MNLQAALSVGNVYQNIAFYTFLTLLAFVVVEIIRLDVKQKKLKASK